MKRLTILALVLLPALIVAQSNHTVSFSGDPANDFNLAEKYTSGVVDYYLTFDASTIYFGAKNTSGNFNPADVLTIFIDTDPNTTPTDGTGLTTGPLYNGVTPSLPFSANYTIKVEREYNESRQFSSNWASLTGLDSSCKCNRYRFVEKFLNRCFKVQSFSRTVV